MVNFETYHYKVEKKKKGIYGVEAHLHTNI